MITVSIHHLPGVHTERRCVSLHKDIISAVMSNGEAIGIGDNRIFVFFATDDNKGRSNLDGIYGDLKDGILIEITGTPSSMKYKERNKLAKVAGEAVKAFFSEIDVYCVVKSHNSKYRNYWLSKK